MRRAAGSALAGLLLVACGTTEPLQGAVDAGADAEALDAPADVRADTATDAAPGVVIDVTSPSTLTAALDADVVGQVIDCVDLGAFRDVCLSGSGVRFSAVIGDANMNGECDPNESVPARARFKSVKGTITTTATTRVLHATVVVNVSTGDLYVRTKELHSTFCGGAFAVQGRVTFDDERPGIVVADTTIDVTLDLLKTSGQPPSSLLVAASSAIRAEPIVIDAIVGTNPAPAAPATYKGDGCDLVAQGTYAPVTAAGGLACGILGEVPAHCDPAPATGNGAMCAFAGKTRDYVQNALQNNLALQIARAINTELSKL